MDKIDRQILEMLLKNGRASVKKMAEQVFLSPPTVASRIERMQEEGIITGFSADLNTEKIGYPLSAYINLSMSPEKRGDFIAFIRQCSNVLECCGVSGPYSMLIKAAFRSVGDLEHFVADLQTFGNTQTQVIFSWIVGPQNKLCPLSEE
jgi:Lrp/AsnC family leucine-responsive transcriptional regulator